MAARQVLTVYQIRPIIGGREVTEFDDVITKTALADPNLTSQRIAEGYEFDAQLYSTAAHPSPPAWAGFLTEAFPEAGIPETATAKAVMIVRVLYYDTPRYFAFTFGHGRFLLKPSSYVPGFGLRVALNAIYEGDDLSTLSAPERIRHVATKTVSANTLRTSKQSNRFATFEAFGMDIRSDLLGGVTGEPANNDRWGTQLHGSDGLRITAIENIADLGTLCRQLLRAATRDDYKARFGWIDHIRVVQDPEILEQLHDRTLAALKQDRSGFVLTLPELVDWDRIAGFHITGTQATLAHLDLAPYLRSYDDLDALEFATLKRHRVTAQDDAGDTIRSWSVFDCLDGEVTIDGTTYLLEAGDYYLIEKRYQRALDRFVDDLPEVDLELPASPRVNGTEQTEGDYNEMAADALGCLLLDKRTVRVDTHTSPIEVCDLFTRERQFVHVKRKLQSSQLSHLFGQGAVSGELFVGSEQFRERTRDQIDDPDYLALIPTTTPAASSYEVVYAIIAQWRRRSLATALPFFSKVNLRRHVEDLQRMGFRVSYRRVNVV